MKQYETSARQRMVLEAVAETARVERVQEHQRQRLSDATAQAVQHQMAMVESHSQTIRKRPNGGAAAKSAKRLKEEAEVAREEEELRLEEERLAVAYGGYDNLSLMRQHLSALDLSSSTLTTNAVMPMDVSNTTPVNAQAPSIFLCPQTVPLPEAALAPDVAEALGNDIVQLYE